MENAKSINENNYIHKKIRFSPIGYTKYLKGFKKVHTMFRQGRVLNSLAVKSWEIAPGNTTITPKAYFLKGQLERITGTAYTDDPITMMQGGQIIKHEPTHVYLLRDVWMLNGSIHKDLHQFKLHPRSQVKTSRHFFLPLY